MGRNGNWLHGNGREWECKQPFPHISSSHYRALVNMGRVDVPITRVRVPVLARLCFLPTQPVGNAWYTLPLYTGRQHGRWTRLVCTESKLRGCRVKVKSLSLSLLQVTTDCEWWSSTSRECGLVSRRSSRGSTSICTAPSVPPDRRRTPLCPLPALSRNGRVRNRNFCLYVQTYHAFFTTTQARSHNDREGGGVHTTSEISHFICEKTGHCDRGWGLGPSPSLASYALAVVYM